MQFGEITVTLERPLSKLQGSSTTFSALSAEDKATIPTVLNSGGVRASIIIH
jgi:hypothetical protein